MKPDQPEERMFNNKLTEAISSLAHEICALRGERKNEFDWLKSHAGLATKQDLREMENRIMSALSEHQAAVDAQYEAIGKSVDEIVASQAGVTADVASLKDIITKLENNPGPISADDQALLTAGLAKVTALASKTAGVSAALKALDEETGEPLPEPPPAPPA